MFLRHKIMFVIFQSLLLLCISICSQAQEDTTDESKSVETKTLPPFPDSIFKFNTKIPSPKRAGLYSALLPGLGQVYNRQYWKLGVIALATGAVSGFLIFNSQKYNLYQKVYLGRIDNDPTTTDTFTNYQLEDIDLLRKTYRKYLEYTVIAGTLSYLINILDAFTSAHLKTFDMSKDLSFKLTPYFDTRRQLGLRLAVALK